MRGHGEGTVGKAKDGRWVARLSLPNGKRKALYASSQAEAIEKKNQVLTDLQKGILPPPQTLTVGEFLTSWLEDSVKPTVRPRTHAGYKDIVTRHLIPALGKKKLARLSPADVQGLLGAKLKAGLSPRSVQYVRAVLRRALGQALKWGLVGRNVAQLVDPPRARRPEIEPLSPEQCRQLLDAARGERLEAFYVVALGLGLRQGEILGLHWGDVDLDGRTLRVRVALQGGTGEPVFAEPKTARSRRTLPLPDFVVTALHAHRARQLQERVRLGAAWQDYDLVFPSAVGTPLGARNLIRHFHGLLEKAGLPRKRFHDLRHACASLLLAQGLHPRVIMETLGHSQIGLTMDTYSHVLPALQREAAEAMDKLLRSASS